MPRAFMPPLNSQWEILDDWEFPLEVKSYNNEDFIAGTGLDYRLKNWPDYGTIRGCPDTSWVQSYHAWVADQKQTHGPLWFPAHTIIQFNRYHASNSGHVEMTLEVIKSPNDNLTPKKAGGKFKGKARFYLDLDAFNNLPELEEYNATT